MAVTITLTDALEKRLKREAEVQHRSVEELALAILSRVLDMEETPSPEAVVAKIQATPPCAANIRPATGSLAEALKNAPVDSDFDLDSWLAAWKAARDEMKAMTRKNDIIEGRG